MTTDGSATDAVFAALAGGWCQTVLAHLQDASATTVEERVTAIETVDNGFRRDGRASEIVVSLHHVHLPMPADADPIEHDRESGQVQYVGGSEIETLLGTASQEPIPELGIGPRSDRRPTRAAR